jgi:HAD superfamily hydrolase (TIGR01509 family)
MRIEAVIFDLDGTLTEPCLDFEVIRREIGVEGPVLEALSGLGAAARRRAEEILERHEREAAARSRLNPQAAEVLGALRRQGTRTAILTRNSRKSLETVLARHRLAVDAVRTREDGSTKPAPEPVVELCRALQVPPSRTLVVGDYLFDLESANAAGAVSVLLRNDHNARFEPHARHTIWRLEELLDLVEA